MAKNFDVEQVFTYHAPSIDQAERYEALREEARTLALLIQNSTPPSREQSVALTKLQEAIMWANAAIAINETGLPAPVQPASTADSIF